MDFTWLDNDLIRDAVENPDDDFNEHFDQGESGACAGIAASVTTHNAQLLYRNGQAEFPNLAEPLDSVTMPDYIGLGPDGGLASEYIKHFYERGIFRNSLFGRHFPESHLRNGVVVRTVDFVGKRPVPRYLADFPIESWHLTVDSDTPREAIVPNVNEALLDNTVVFQTWVADDAKFGVRNENPWPVNRPPPDIDGSQPTDSEIHLSREKPADNPDAVLHAMVVYGIYPAGKPIQLGFRWKGPPPVFGEDTYLVYNSWRTSNLGWVFIPVSEMQNIVESAVHVVPKQLKGPVLAEESSTSQSSAHDDTSASQQSSAEDEDSDTTQTSESTSSRPTKRRKQS